MLTIFKTHTDDTEHLDTESSGSEGQCSPGRQLAAAQKQDNDYNEAAKFLYKATLRRMDTKISPQGCH